MSCYIGRTLAPGFNVAGFGVRILGACNSKLAREALQLEGNT